ncbi:MAG: HD domain-containing protein [Solirubrobacteraceae bacterium]
MSASKGSVVKAGRLGDVTLHLGWVSDVPPPPNPRAAGVVLGARFDRAVALARQLHARQLRKGTEIPYVSHLLGVASLVLEDGGDEDEAIAALLHDAVEDQGGEHALKQIEQLFGTRVAAIVQACSDTDVTPKLPWRARKETYIAHLHDPALPAGTVRVSLADKLHNARAILFDLRAGHDVFARFSADRSQQGWYYGALVDAFAGLTESPMVPELRRVVRELFGDDQGATAIVAPSSISTP